MKNNKGVTQIQVENDLVNQLKIIEGENSLRKYSDAIRLTIQVYNQHKPKEKL